MNAVAWFSSCGPPGAASMGTERVEARGDDEATAHATKSHNRKSRGFRWRDTNPTPGGVVKINLMLDRRASWANRIRTRSPGARSRWDSPTASAVGSDFASPVAPDPLGTPAKLKLTTDPPMAEKPANVCFGCQLSVLHFPLRGRPHPGSGLSRWRPVPPGAFLPP